jgi:hypothetical protein
MNGDGFVDYTDFVIFVMAYGSQEGDPNWDPAADLDWDGKVDFTDFLLLADAYGVPC